METNKGILSKQYMKQETCRDTANIRFHHINRKIMKPDSTTEPIDLTITPSDLTQPNSKTVEMNNYYLLKNNENYVQNCKFKKNSRPDTNEDMLQLSQRCPQTKQHEILKAAKSLFSKRTRTLYHWMYPATSKQQIKSAVSTSWDSLDESEKAFYISQVLGRFGFNHNSLMINPQLCSLKELQPLVKKPKIQSNSKELQNAISSITSEVNINQVYKDSLSFEEFEALREKNKKRRGRPKMIKPTRSFREDFQDDPELNNELKKFSTKFNLNKFN